MKDTFKAFRLEYESPFRVRVIQAMQQHPSRPLSHPQIYTLETVTIDSCGRVYDSGSDRFSSSRPAHLGVIAVIAIVASCSAGRSVGHSDFAFSLIYTFLGRGFLHPEGIVGQGSWDDTVLYRIL